MQYGTILQSTRRMSGIVLLAGLLIGAAAIGAVTVERQLTSTLALPAAALVSEAAPQPLQRAFADQAGYIATVGEYAGLGEDYLPLGPAEAGAAPIGAQRRVFADETGYVVAASEYARLGEDYLPRATGLAIAVQRPLTNRFFADEVVGAASLDLQANPIPGWSDEVTPVSGPR